MLMPRDPNSPPPPPPPVAPLTAFPPPSPTIAVESPPPPAPIGTPAPDLGVNEAFEYVVFSLITVFVILYSVYLALIREDDDEERDEEEGGREGRTANIDDDDDDDASTSAAARSSVLSKLTNELKETMSVGNERVKKSARNMVDAWTKRGERKEATKESTSMSFMGAFFGGKKKTKTDRTDGSSLLDYTSSGDDVVSLLSVNEEDFFEEDVLETDDEAMWAPYFREEEQGEDQRSYRNNSTITRNIARNLHGGL